MQDGTELLATHTEAARTVAANGGVLSKKWLEIESRYEAYLYRQSSVIDDLCDAVLSGSDELELNLRYGLAMAKAAGIAGGSTAPAEAVINGEVRTRVAGALILEYRKTADENLKRVAAAFALNLQRFRSLTEQVDVETTAESLINAPDEARMAWLKAPEAAQELDKNLNGLRAAAWLTGARLDTHQGSLIGLVCPTDGVGKERRAMWAAWDTGGRTGRWGALLAAGIEVSAIDSPQKYRSYARPQKIVKYENVHMGAGVMGIRETWVDAEDGSLVEGH
ncbi:hypothetical protein D5S18_15920 [Nocardia panacis]|uniref:Uncharacterized protein n=1 Tax=Nocardia panacis TaxID=2340916 RepID=A0A3A4KJ45_9NOCA|nr:hypothetical protein [Nocardia panacis]RJO74902.1 hypothetical protein D5S18_15920 [Nocardia panacis]